MNIDYFKFSVPFSQLKKKADSLKITEEKFKERAMLFLSKEEASNFTRSVFHPKIVFTTDYYSIFYR